MLRQRFFKEFVIIMVALIFNRSLLAQSPTTTKASFLNGLHTDSKKVNKALSIGDQVPDIVFENVLNYKRKKIKLSDFKGKLVILDMWSIFCTACIGAFPKMEELQNEYDEKIQILLVNPHDPKYDSEENIITTLEKFKRRTGFYPSLPVPIHDSILNLYFPHKSIPHHVWISGDGKIAAITGSYEVTKENIKSLLNGQGLSLPVKNDWAFDREKPLLVDGNGGDTGDFIFRSLFTGYNGGIGFGSGVRLNEKGEVTGIYRLNETLKLYINEAYDEFLNGLPENRIILKSDNPERYKWEFDAANAYSYDLTLPPTLWKSVNVKKHLQEDLRRFFNISVRMETHKVNCIVITASNEVTSLYTKYHKQELDLNASSIRKFIHNYPIDQALKSLDRFKIPLVNETGITNHIDLDFPDNINLSDKEAVLSALKKAGFTIKEEMRELEVVVISDKNE